MVGPGNLKSTRAPILLVDDKAANLLALEVALLPLADRCSFIQCQSGAEAIEILRTQTVAAVLLDIQMPGMDGFETAKKIRGQQMDDPPPIVFISAYDPTDLHIESAYESGAADFISKPVDPRILISKVRIFIELFEARKRATQTAQLETTERILDQIFDESPSFMALLSVPEFRFLKSNAEHQKLTRKKDFIGKTVLEVEPELEAQGIMKLLNKVVRTGESLMGKEVRIHYEAIGDQPAKSVYLDFIYQPLKRSSGDIYAIAVQGYDVTEKVLSRRAVENERENFRNLFRQTPEMVCILSGPEHRFEFVNEAHIKALGFDATGMAVRVAQPESVEVHGLLDGVYLTGKTASLHEIPVTLGDRVRYFNLTYAARRNEAGEINGIMILGAEVTEQVDARNALEESQQRYQLLYDYSPLPKWIIDEETLQFVDVNQAAIRHYGYSKEEFLSMKATDIRPAEDVPGFIEAFQRDFTNPENKYDKRRRHYKKDGSLIDVEVHALDIQLNGRKQKIGAIVDVTEKVRARKAIQDAADAAIRERRSLEEVLDETSVPLALLLGKEHRFAFTNSAYNQIFEFKDSPVGFTVSELFPEAIQPGFIDLLNEVYETGKPFSATEAPFIRKSPDGSTRSFFLDYTYAAKRNTSGEIEGVLAAVVDVTEKVLARKKVEEAEQALIQEADRLAVERKKLADIFYGSDFPMALFRGPDLIYEMANQKYLQLIGYRDVIGQSLAQALPEISKSEFPAKIKAVYDTGIPVRFLEGHTPILNVQTGELEDRYFDTTFARISDGEGRDFLVIGNAMDVTERVRARVILEKAQKEAESARHQLYSFFMQAPAPMVILTGPSFHFTLANSLYEAYVGRKVIGKNLRDVFSKEEFGYYIPLLEHVYKTGEPFVGRDLPFNLTTSGDSIHQRRIDLSFTPFRNEEGNTEGILVFIQDVTDPYKARTQMEAHNRDLLLAKEEADRANRLKSAFLANMSHEIRTPLGAILGFTDLLREPQIPEEDRSKYIDIVTRNGEQLASIINDILDLSKVEAGHLVLDYTETSPRVAAEDVISLLKVKANEKNLELQYIAEASSPEFVRTDDLRLRQILMNLIGNAVKFTQTGFIKVRSYSETDPQTAKRRLCIEVADTGIGIPATDFEKIFDAFVQADVTLSRRYGGTGLGLALSRKLARSLGGDITVLQSVEGQGTTFLMTILDQDPSTHSPAERSI